MAVKARLEAQITGDDAPFIAAVNRAEKRAQTFNARLVSMFKRDPSRRAEQALSGFVSSLATGDIQGAVTGISNRLTGLGLAAGVGVGAAIVIFEKAQGQINAVDEAVKKLNADLAKPVALQGALGPEGISKEIETTKKDLDDLVAKRKGIFQQIREAGQRSAGFAPDVYNTATGEVEKATSQVPEAQKAQEAAEQRLKDLGTARANAELEIVKAKTISLSKSEEEGALYKLQLDTQAKIAKLQLDQRKPGSNQVDIFKEMTAVQQNAKLIAAAIKDQNDQKERQLTLDASLAQMEEDGVSTANLKMAALKGELEIIQQQLSSTRLLTDNERTGLQIAEQRAKLRIAKEEYNQRNDPGEGGIWQTPEQREQASFNKFQRDKSEYGEKSRHLDMSGNEINPSTRSTLEQRSARVPGAYNGPMDKDWHKEGIPGLTTMSAGQAGKADGKTPGQDGGKDVGAALSGIEKNTSEMVRLWNN